MLYVDKDGQVKGVLNDWDMASFRDALGKVDRSMTAQNRTGTPLFIAIDLLKKNPPHHLYRHELESFFYILLWGALHYDLAAGVRLSTVEVVTKWVDDFENIANAKARFFDDPEQGQEILDAIRPEFQNLRQEWIEPLYRLISDARLSARRHRRPSTKPYDQDTYGGRLTFWTFMDAIQQKPRWAKRMEAKETKGDEAKEGN